MIRFTRDGRSVILRDGDTLNLTPLDGEAEERTIDVPGLLDFVAFESEIWAVVDAPLRLLRYSLTGQSMGHALALPSLAGTKSVTGEADPAGRLVAAPFGDPSALWLGAQSVEIQLVDGALGVVPFEESEGMLVPLSPGRTLELAGGQFRMRGGGETRTFVAAGDHEGTRLLDGAALFEERSVALLLERAGVQTLLVMATREGLIQHRLNLSGIRRASFASQRGHAVLLQGEKRLSIYDLRFGKLLKTWEEQEPVLDFAVDAAARHLVLQRAGAAGTETFYGSYRELLGAVIPVGRARTNAPPGTEKKTAGKNAAGEKAEPELDEIGPPSLDETAPREARETPEPSRQPADFSDDKSEMRATEAPGEEASAASTTSLPASSPPSSTSSPSSLPSAGRGPMPLPRRPGAPLGLRSPMGRVAPAGGTLPAAPGPATTRTAAPPATASTPAALTPAQPATATTTLTTARPSQPSSPGMGATRTPAGSSPRRPAAPPMRPAITPVARGAETESALHAALETASAATTEADVAAPTSMSASAAVARFSVPPRSSLSPSRGAEALPRAAPAPVRVTPRALASLAGAGRRDGHRETVVHRSESHPLLDDELLWVAALCEHAIAVGWDTGRLAPSVPGELPGEREVRALLHPQAGLATQQRRAAEAQLAAAEGARAGSEAARKRALVWRELGLSQLEADLVLLLAAPSLWGEFGRLYEILSGSFPGSGPWAVPSDGALLSELLLARLLDTVDRDAIYSALDDDSPLLRLRVIVRGAGPKTLAPLRVEPNLVRRLRLPP